MAKTLYQNGLTIVSPILPAKEHALRETLLEIYDDVEENSLVPLLRCERIHFARWVLYDASHDAEGRPTPPTLVFSTNYDAPLTAHLDELFDVGAAGLDRIYSCCVGYPPEGERTKDRVLAYLRAHDQGHDTLYVGTRGMTLRQIRGEAILRDAIEDFLDTTTQDPAVLAQEPAAIRESIRSFVGGREDLRWALDPPPTPRRFWPYGSDAVLMALIVGLLVALPLAVGIAASPRLGLATFAGVLGALALALGAAAATLRYKETRDREVAPVTDFDHLEALLHREDVRSEGRPIVQNQMSSVTNVKPGWFRRTVLSAVLTVIDVAGRYVYTTGKLGSIPSIHFARWVLIEDGRRLLFLSNFDGSWENYLGDFIDKAATGLTAVWSNTDGFPRTRWLIRDGATDEQRFKAYARMSQVRTEVWYTAYKYLSVQNIWTNARIRAGLSGDPTPDEAAAWLRLF